MAVIQAFNRERAFLDEFDKANDANRAHEHVRAVAELALLPGHRVPRRRSRWSSVLWVGGRLLDARLAHDRDARLGRLPAEPRLPAAAGALRSLRPGAVGGRRDGEDQPRARHRARDPRRARTRARRTRIEGDLHIDRVSVRVRARAGAARDRHPRAGRRLPRARRRVGRRQVDDREARRPLLRPRRGRDPRRRRSTCASSSCARTAASSASCCRIRSCSPARSPTTSGSRGPRRPTRWSPTSRARSASSASPAASRRGCCTRCARAAPGLSAGERQLISIARALLADPRILIFDEATSNIDRPTEVLIEQRARPAAPRPHLDHHRPPARHRPPGRRDRRARARAHRRSAGSSTSCSPTEGPFRELAATRAARLSVGRRAAGQSAPVIGSRASSSASVVSSEPE